MERRGRHRIILLLLAVGFPFFFIGGPGYHDARSFKAVWDLGHILFFSLASTVVYEMLFFRREGIQPFSLFFIVFLLVFIIGLLIEFLQAGGSGRNPSFYDVLRNQLGVLVGALYYYDWSSLRSVALRRGAWVIIISLMLSALWPLTRSLSDERRALEQFPVLSDFETPFEVSRWRTERQLARVSAPVRHGKRSMRVQLSTSKYSGTGLFYFPGDWSGYRWLNFSVYNTQKRQLRLYARINDQDHGRHKRVFKDRFNTRFLLNPGWNTFCISLEKVRLAPENRQMNMREIVGFGIFVVQEPRPVVIYLDNIYLSN